MKPPAKPKKDWSDPKKWIMGLIASVILISISTFLMPFIKDQPGDPDSTTRSIMLGDSSTESGVGPFAFYLKDIADSTLSRAIAQQSGLEYNAMAAEAVAVSFSHTGQVRQAMARDFVTFDGGVVTILVNGRLCKELNRLTITSWSSPEGNPRDLIESELTRQLRSLVLGNIEYVAGEVAGCLRPEP